ncbi:MAG: spermidine/putrescine ABC transporter permease PotC, partial [Pseudomonadota bacterium]|nr:spermidine/putrescine ABC transporter permease PotC [Pseudomonadota bacterium]
QETLPTYMLGQLRRFITPETNAIATANIVVSVVLVSGFFLLTRNRN